MKNIQNNQQKETQYVTVVRLKDTKLIYKSQFLSHILLINKWNLK